MTRVALIQPDCIFDKNQKIPQCFIKRDLEHLSGISQTSEI